MPLIADFISETRFDARIERTRQGQPAFWADERSVVANQIRILSKAQRKALFDLLIRKPPQPGSKAIKNKPALKGEPTTAKLMHILSGALFNERPRCSDAQEKAVQDAFEFREDETAEGETSDGWLGLIREPDRGEGTSAR